MIETKRGRIASFALRYGGPSVTIDDFPEYGMEEIYDIVNRRDEGARPRGDGDREVEEETKTEKAARLRATLRKDVVSSFNKIMQKYEDMSLGNKTRLSLDFSESRTQLEKKLVEGYISTHDDIKKNDKDWDGPDGIREIEVTDFGELKRVETFYLIMKMLNRLEEREEVFQDKKKAKQYWKSTQMKRVEEIVKPENRFIYREAKDFLPWIVDHKKLMEALPEELEEDMIIKVLKECLI